MIRASAWAAVVLTVLTTAAGAASWLAVPRPEVDRGDHAARDGSGARATDPWQEQQQRGRRTLLESAPGTVGRPTRAQWRRGQSGFATFYGSQFDGRRTASGERFDNSALLAAHPSHPFGTVLRVTNLANGRTVEVRVVDRGPARRLRADGVVIDLSQAAARALDFIKDGRTRVRLEVVRSGASAAGRRTEAAADPASGTGRSAGAGSQE